MRRAGAVVLLAVVAWILPIFAVAGSAQSVGDYARTLHTIRRQLDRAAAGPRLDVATVRSVQARLRALGAVPIGDGRFVATEGKLFAATIDPTSAVSVRHAARAIDALDAQLHRAPIGVRDAAANSALRRAYETPRFHQTCAGTACVGAWVGEHIGSQVTHFLVWLFNHAPGSADLSTALTTMSILILFAALVGLGLLLRRGALRRMTVRVPRRDLNLPDEAIDDPDTMAASAYGAGELRTAYRYLFLATLLALQERGLLRLQPGWTNRDHLLTLRDAPQSTQDALRRMTDTFDRVWYGHESLDRATYDSLVTVSLSLRAGSQEAVA